MEKNWNAMEKLWKSYGISFLGICTNPGSRKTALNNHLYQCHHAQQSSIIMGLLIYYTLFHALMTHALFIFHSLNLESRSRSIPIFFFAFELHFKTGTRPSPLPSFQSISFSVQFDGKNNVL